jgi:hypothetical protein
MPHTTVSVKLLMRPFYVIKSTLINAVSLLMVSLCFSYRRLQYPPTIVKYRILTQIKTNEPVVSAII